MTGFGRTLLTCLALALPATLIASGDAEAAARHRSHSHRALLAAHHRSGAHATRLARSGGATVRVIRARQRPAPMAPGTAQG